MSSLTLLIWPSLVILFLFFQALKSPSSQVVGWIAGTLLFLILLFFQLHRLAFEVLDDGHSLWVKKRGNYIEVPYSQIKNISSGIWSKAGILIIELDRTNKLNPYFKFQTVGNVEDAGQALRQKLQP